MNDDNISRVARASSVASEVGVGGRRKILTKKSFANCGKILLWNGSKKWAEIRQLQKYSISNIVLQIIFLLSFFLSFFSANFFSTWFFYSILFWPIFWWPLSLEHTFLFLLQNHSLETGMTWNINNVVLFIFVWLDGWDFLDPDTSECKKHE